MTGDHNTADLVCLNCNCGVVLLGRVLVWYGLFKRNALEKGNIMKHYKYGSSTAGRTQKCRAWHYLSKGIPRSEPSQAAQEGTTMHKVFEMCANDPKLYVDNFINTEVEGLNFTTAMADKVFEGLLLLDKLVEEHVFDFDQEVTMNEGELIGGTADVVMLNKHDNKFGVADLKTGDGNIIQAKNNSQLLFCAALMIQHYDLRHWVNDETEVVLAIIQPTDRRDDPLDVWTTDVRTVMDFWDSFKLSVNISEGSQAIPSAGTHCKFCPAQTNCPAKTGQVDKALRLSTDSMELERLNEAMAIVDEVEAWCREVRKLAHEQAERGVKINGWKLVNKRATRQWDEDDGELSSLMTDAGLTLEDIYESKLITPAKAEKIFKKKELDFSCMKDYIVSKSSGTTLAHDDDKRPEALPLNGLTAMANAIKN